MKRHPDDLDLLAFASQTLDRHHPVSRHVRQCAVCQARVLELEERVREVLPEGILPSQMLTSLPVPVRPPWRRRRALPARALRLGLVLAFLLVGVWEWPRVVWPGRVPSGPVSLEVLAAGRSVRFRPVRANRGLLRIEWMTARHWAYVVGVGLPPPPKGRVYELWWIHGKEHLRAGLFRPDAAGRVAFWLQAPMGFTELRAVGVTLEPSGGSERPTGPRMFFALLSSR